MFCFKFLFVSLLLTGSNFPDSLCAKKLRKDQTSERQYNNRKEDARLRTPEKKSAGDSQDDGSLLFPIDIFAMCENSWQSENLEQRKDAHITNRPQTSDRPYGRSNSSGGRKSPREMTPSLSRTDISKPPNRNPSDPTPLLECMLNVVKLSLPLVIVGQASDPLENFLGIIDDLSGEVSAAKPVAIAISSDTLKSFVDVATSCLELLKQGRNGRLVLDEDFATSASAEATKQHPMGALALGATEALVDNVSVTYDRNRKRQYNINYTGLTFGLGMAAVKTTKIGQIASKSTEGRSWLSKSVGRITEGSDQRNQSPPNQIALLECTLNAAISSLSITATVDQGHSLVNNQPGSTQSVLESFVMAVTPCFGLFKRHENGKLGLGNDIIAEAIKLDPMGMLAVGSADAIVASVSATPDSDGSIQYNINYSELATDLGSAVVESAKIGQPTPIPAESNSRLNRSFSRYLWGPNPSLSCEPTPVGLATVLKCARTCAVKTFEGLWLTRSIGQIIRGIGPRKRIPTNLVQLLGCISKAVVTSLFGGIFRMKPKRAATGTAGEPGNPITPNVLEAFIKKATPCFAFFKRNEHGMLELDPAFIRGTAAEALRLLPVGALVVGTIEVIAKNVREVRDEEGKLQYKINYPGLTTGLSAVVVDATTFGLGGMAADLVTSLL